VGILILPLFDTLRVFTTRILRRKSPLAPDRRHIHHLLIDAGMTHMKATGTLVLVNIFFIAVVLCFQSIGTFNLLCLILFIAVVLTLFLHRYVYKREPNPIT